MAKWRGYGGLTGHWDRTVESLTMCCGLAEATSRMDLYCTVHTTVFHPVAVAKMMATFDQIAKGRAGMNIVAKAHMAEVAQMGIPEIEESRRYDYAREWIGVIKSLWTEDRVNFDGDFFHIEDCVSDPKPIRTPRPPLICAGISDIGRQFTIEETDGCLISGQDHEALKERSLRVKEIADSLGRTTNTLALVMIVPGKTDADAIDRVNRYNRAGDFAALENMTFSSAIKREPPAGWAPVPMERRAVGAMSGYPLAGDRDGIVALLTDLFENGKLDGVVLTVPDFIDDLEWFGEKVLPVMQSRGFTRQLKAAVA